jgi:hypothetical protein
LQFFGQIEQPGGLMVPQAIMLSHAPALEKQSMNGQRNNESHDKGYLAANSRRYLGSVQVQYIAGKECRLCGLSAIVIGGSGGNFSTKRARGNRRRGDVLQSSQDLGQIRESSAEQFVTQILSHCGKNSLIGENCLTVISPLW